jgi:hypothetical protein
MVVLVESVLKVPNEEAKVLKLLHTWTKTDFLYVHLPLVCLFWFDTESSYIIQAVLELTV